MKKWIVLIAVVLTLYFLSYVVFRQTHSEIWEEDGRQYVVFPMKKLHLYYIYRPLSYIDGTLTGIQFHIGEHQ